MRVSTGDEGRKKEDRRPTTGVGMGSGRVRLKGPIGGAGGGVWGRRWVGVADDRPLTASRWREAEPPCNEEKWMEGWMGEVKGRE
jgi:hypothetical protein